MTHFLLFFVLILNYVKGAFDITQFGAIPYSDNVKDQFNNQKAIM